MSQVCRVKMETWQRKDGKWGCKARLDGPGKRKTKLTHTGHESRESVEDAMNGDINELMVVMGWEREDVSDG